MQGLSCGARVFLYVMLLVPVSTWLLTGDIAVAGAQLVVIIVMSGVYVQVEDRTTRK